MSTSLTPKRGKLQAQQEIEYWLHYYNTNRPHSSPGYKTPIETYSVIYDR